MTILKQLPKLNFLIQEDKDLLPIGHVSLVIIGTFSEAVDRFNCNIPYNGLLHAVSQDVSR